jgi:cytochrome c-type biogenesis protein CcmH/NrfG
MRKVRHFGSIAAAAAGLFLPHKAKASEDVTSLTQKGDIYYGKLQATEALKYYLPAEKLDPNNPKLLVRIAREYRHLMSDARDKAEKTRLGTTAVHYAEHAVEVAPEDAEAHLAVAIGYGKLMPLLATRDQIADAQVIKTAVDKTLALDPNNDLGWHILGRYYLNLADVGSVKRALAQMVYGKMPAGSFSDAIRCFEKAIALNPNRLMHYIELGRAYVETGQPDLARKFVTKGLSMPNTEKDDPEMKQLGRDLLAKLR